jgi:hypothetical protein
MRCLYKEAEKLVKSKSDARYPKSARPSSFEKRLTFLARALAGITVGMSPRRAVNILEEVTRREKLSGTVFNYLNQQDLPLVRGK